MTFRGRWAIRDGDPFLLRQTCALAVGQVSGRRDGHGQMGSSAAIGDHDNGFRQGSNVKRRLGRIIVVNWAPLQHRTLSVNRFRPSVCG